jgi:hypothetical protein
MEGKEMYCEKETDKALLMVHDGVSFWIQKRWLSNKYKDKCNLSPKGWKAFFIAKRKQTEHAGFDALKEFEVIRETDKAVLLKGIYEKQDDSTVNIQFWLPRSMARNFNFVAQKIREEEQKQPFVGEVKWSGGAAHKKAG